MKTDMNDLVTIYVMQKIDNNKKEEDANSDILFEWNNI